MMNHSEKLKSTYAPLPESDAAASSHDKEESKQRVVSY
jgi:hypothetical protein